MRLPKKPASRNSPPLPAGEGWGEGSSAPPLGGPRRPSAETALRIVLLWTGAALFIATQRYLRGPSLEPSLALSWGRALAASGVTAAIWALLTPACLRAARRWRPRRGAFFRNLGLLAAAGVAAALFHLLVTTAFWSVADAEGRGPDFLGTVVATLAFGGAARLATFFAIAGVAWGIDDFRAYRDTELRASELERDLVGAQLETLKLRLQPGFLFDTLATLLPLIRNDPATAARTVVRLGDILRLALHHDADGCVPLREELAAARTYLAIEETRLPGRLEVSFDVAADAADAAVPALLLMPLCEGAIANGPARRAGRSRISVRARAEDDALRLEVEESPLEPPDAGSPAAFDFDDSFARRTRERLELLFPGGRGLAVSGDGSGGHRVALWLPHAAATAPTLSIRGAA